MAVIGYGKIGRAVSLSQDGWGTVGGDNEPPRLLDTLARRHPEHTFIIMSRCDDDPQRCGLPDNVFNSWTPDRREWFRDQVAKIRTNVPMNTFESAQALGEVTQAMMVPYASMLDGVVMWVGQHGPANSIIPAVTRRTEDTSHPGWVRPYDSFNTYAGGIIRAINAWRDRDPLRFEEIWLIADSRNVIHGRDIKWPARHPVLGQFNLEKTGHHERFGDTRSPDDCGFGNGIAWRASDHTWKSKTCYTYSRLEVCGILPHHVHDGATYSEDWSGRRSFGLFVNEAGAIGQQNRRRDVLPEWVLPLNPAFIHGKWTDKSQREVGRVIEPLAWDLYYPYLRSVRSTFTTPSSCSGWATTKPWEAFMSGTVCFRHPGYDTQDNIYGDLPDDVREWLSPPTPGDLAARIAHVDADHGTWLYLVRAQRALYDHAVSELRHVKMIEDRLGYLS